MLILMFMLFLPSYTVERRVQKVIDKNKNDKKASQIQRSRPTARRIRRERRAKIKKKLRELPRREASRIILLRYKEDKYIAMSKVPIDKLPVELRIKIYELGDVNSITDLPPKYEAPWARTILMSGILNDKDAIEIAAIQGDEPRRIMCNYIAVSGNLPMMKWARSDRSSRKDEATGMIDRSMKQVRLTPFPWDEMTCFSAAKFGHFKLLLWLHEQRCPWNRWTFSSAAVFGNLDILKWLYLKKCPWDSDTFTNAAESGNFDVLKWLHERKCPWDEDTFTAAVRTGNLEMIKWLDQHDCPFYVGECVEAAEGDLDILNWLHDRERKRRKVVDEILADARDCVNDDIYSWAVLNDNYRARRTYDYDPYLDGSEEDYFNSAYDWLHAEEESASYDGNHADPDNDEDDEHYLSHAEEESAEDDEKSHAEEESEDPNDSDPGDDEYDLENEED
jgi:hypothetical protein